MLSATGIVKAFDGKPVLNGVGISIAPGKITCVIGPSGTGKTTLLRVLGLLDYPDKGNVSINDVSYDFPMHKTADITPPWPQITAVFQSLFLWPHMTLRENIMLPAQNINSNIEADLAELIKTFEMNGFIDNYPNQASVGQRQRVAIARALILNPEYILMDEVTSALDIEQTARILTKIADLKKKNIGVFLITHHIEFAKKVADHVVFMDGGVILEEGSAAILSKPKTGRLKEFLSMAEIAF